MNTYIPFHVHTEYSLLDSCDKPQTYIDLATRDGAKAISFSEHGKPLNWTEKWAACREAGIRYIHSVEIYMTENLEPKVRDNYHTVLMAKNMDGVRELNTLITKSCDKDHFYYTNRISFDEFLALSDNIISTSACLASPLNKLPTDHPRYRELAKKYDFLEVQPHEHPDQREFNKRLLELSKELGKPLIAGTDTHSSSPYKAECRAILLKSKKKSYGDEDAFDLTYKTYDELVDMFRKQDALPEDEYLKAIENTNLLYDMTEDIELDTAIKYPILYGSRERDNEKFEETVERKFREKVESGIIPESQSAAFREAIDEEMRVFRKLEMGGFMLSMSELVSWCKEQGMAIGTARGSVGGSRVAYVTDIIDLNPETWHTVFSRFANEHRKEIGDIDIDCVEGDRPAIFKYITDRFGAERTARVASFGTLQEKGAIDDIGRALASKWNEEHPGGTDNPWSLPNISHIKSEYEKDPDGAKKEYHELFYYFDGLVDTKISQSIHPAGMVISPITLNDNYGTFDKEGETCLFLDMDNVHDYTGLAKYDFLVLKTVQVIRDACVLAGIPYPKTHEIDWNDAEVWDDIIKSPAMIFQMEGAYAFKSLKTFKPRNIFDMALVTACIRPTGASYRDQLLKRVPHQNPSPMIDELLKNNLGYLVYQEDTIAFLQQICGLSGGEADNIRRAIGRKQKDRLDKAMPDILKGYCEKSDKPREVAEEEAKEFLQVIEDSASYQFGYNHAIAYCLLGYLCAYFRHYHPLEFITSFLNNAANEDDIRNGTEYAHDIGINVTMPRWGVSRSDYYFDAERGIISKGVSSLKGIGSAVGEKLYAMAHSKKYGFFVDVLRDINEGSVADKAQTELLIKLDYFSEFGNQRELVRIKELFYEHFGRGHANSIARDKVDGTPLEPIVKKYAVGTTKSGGVAKRYTLLNIDAILREAETAIKSLGLSDLEVFHKVKNYADILGYPGYISGREEDRRVLYVLDIFPAKRKKDKVQFGYNIVTKSVGSGVEARFTIFNTVYKKDPIKKGDLIYCKAYTVDRSYFTMRQYEHVYA